MKMKNPKIYFYNVTTGSGVETTGNRIESMFREYSQRYPKKFYVYRHQNPPHLMLEDLAEQKPNVIIMNELHQRCMIAVHAYKTLKPKTKIVLLNHCYPYLTDFPVPTDSVLFEWCNEDGAHDINHFLKSKIEHIINLNYRPPEETIHPTFEGKVIERYFPIEDAFKIRTPWSKRPHDFFFYGSIYPLKLSGEFIYKFAEQKEMVMDIYGNWRRDPENETRVDYLDYKRTIEDSSAFNYLGRIPDERLIQTINQYKFFVLPHDGPEPFCLCLAEAIRCGCIPLVVNVRRQKWGRWIDWAKDCIVEYQSVDKLLEKMRYYVRNKGNQMLEQTLEQRSFEISKTMSERTDYNSFRELLHNLTFKP